MQAEKVGSETTLAQIVKMVSAAQRSRTDPAPRRGALLMTIGIFLPAFGFSLLFHNQLERLMEREVLREVLEGVAAGVVGIIASTLITLGARTITI